MGEVKITSDSILSDRSLSRTDKTHKEKCLIIYTGGTFGMGLDETTNSLVPLKGALQSQLADMWELSHEDCPSYDVMEWDNPLDSSDFSLEEWVTLAEQIRDNYLEYDGFVILHGTDTLAYTASALSFMLSNLGKTVILTGAVVPLCEIHNDARRNLIISVLCSVRSNIAEVCVFFDNTLLRGNRCSKVDSGSVDAFLSPNLPPLAIMGVKVKFNRELVRPYPIRPLRVHLKLFDNILVLQLTPGFSNDMLRAIIEHGPSPRALVLCLYGTGNGPTHREGFVEMIGNAIQERETEIVIVSQCPYGTIDLRAYETGRRMVGLGVIEGRDMTKEAVVTKLSFLMGLGLRGMELKRAMETDLRGELTVNSTETTNVYSGMSNKSGKFLLSAL